MRSTMEVEPRINSPSTQRLNSQGAKKQITISLGPSLISGAARYAPRETNYAKSRAQNPRDVRSDRGTRDAGACRSAGARLPPGSRKERCSLHYRPGTGDSALPAKLGEAKSPRPDPSEAARREF